MTRAGFSKRGLCILGGIAAIALGASATAQPAKIQEPADIAKANQDWLPAMTACDAARVTRPYAEDGLFIGVNGEVIKGRAAIEALYRKRLSPCPHIIGGDIQSEGVANAGPDTVYEWGAAHLVVLDPAGKTSTHGGRYLTVWRRQPDGVWRIIRNLTL